MKKKYSSLAIVLCMAMVFGLALSACGGGDSKKDYSAYTYTEYAKEDWDSKTLSYQMYTTEVVNGPMGIQAEYLMNLYEDGGALLYQAGLWDTTSVEDAHWYDQENHIAWAYFGTWEETDGQIVVRMVGDLAAKTDTVDMTAADEDWIRCVPSDRDNEDKMGQTVQIKVATTGDNAFAFNGGDDYSYLPMGSTNKIMGAALQDNEGDGSNAQGGLELSSTAKYASISDWVATYIDSDFAEGQGGM